MEARGIVGSATMFSDLGRPGITANRKTYGDRRFALRVASGTIDRASARLNL
jgi:hypothetical protein